MLNNKSPWKTLLLCLIFALPIAVANAQTGWWANASEPRLFQYSGSLTTPDLIQIEIEHGTGRRILHGHEALVFLLNRHYVAYNPQGQLYFTNKYLAWERSHNEDTPGFGQIFNDIVQGTWKFGRRAAPPGYPTGFLTNLKFTAEPGKYGYILKGADINESFWNLSNDGVLVIRDINGHPTTILRRSPPTNPNYWEGPFTNPPGRNFPPGITHYIEREQPSLANTTFPPLRGQGWKFNSPSIDGLPLDWCHTWASNCGQGAATAFCQSKGYRSAIDFKGPNLAPNRTKIIGSGQICEGNFCGTFDYIICGR